MRGILNRVIREVSMKKKRLGKDLTSGGVCHKADWGKSSIVENTQCRSTWSMHGELPAPMSR